MTQRGRTSTSSAHGSPGRVSVLIGHSGVGKSTLVNALVPGTDRATGHVNAVTGRGRHTSTSALMLALPTTDRRAAGSSTPPASGPSAWRTCSRASSSGPSPTSRSSPTTAPAGAPTARTSRSAASTTRSPRAASTPARVESFRRLLASRETSTVYRAPSRCPRRRGARVAGEHDLHRARRSRPRTTSTRQHLVGVRDAACHRRPCRWPGRTGRAAAKCRPRSRRRPARSTSWTPGSPRSLCGPDQLLEVASPPRAPHRTSPRRTRSTTLPDRANAVGHRRQPAPARQDREGDREHGGQRDEHDGGVDHQRVRGQTGDLHVQHARGWPGAC